MSGDLFMPIQFPSQVGADRLFDNIGHMTASHSHVMFEAVLAEVFHEVLQIAMRVTAMPPSMP